MNLHCKEVVTDLKQPTYEAMTDTVQPAGSLISGKTKQKQR